jgi:hypothetical protein
VSLRRPGCARRAGCDPEAEARGMPDSEGTRWSTEHAARSVTDQISAQQRAPPRRATLRKGIKRGIAAAGGALKEKEEADARGTGGVGGSGDERVLHGWLFW